METKQSVAATIRATINMIRANVVQLDSILTTIEEEPEFLAIAEVLNLLSNEVNSVANRAEILADRLHRLVREMGVDQRHENRRHAAGRRRDETICA